MILVFAGAGASRAVTERLPTTLEFFNRLSDSIRGDSLFRYIVGYLERQLNTDVIDIEQVLWVCGELLQTTNQLLDPQTPFGNLLAHDRGSRTLGTTFDVSHIQSLSQQISTNAEALRGEINSRVYDLYSYQPSVVELESNWLALFHALTATPTNIELFTTNYDLVIEAAIRISKANFATGRTEGELRTLDESIWTDDVAKLGACGRLTKLHGSIDWARQGQSIFVGNAGFRRDHRDHVIIYPGFKGVPTDSPMSLFHEHFGQTVSRAEQLLFIGFAFRDEYINELLRQRTRAEAKIAVIGVGELPSAIPFPRSRVSYFDQGFGSSALSGVIQQLWPNSHR